MFQFFFQTMCVFFLRELIIFSHKEYVISYNNVFIFARRRVSDTHMPNYTNVRACAIDDMFRYGNVRLSETFLIDD